MSTRSSCHSCSIKPTALQPCLICVITLIKTDCTKFVSSNNPRVISVITLIKECNHVDKTMHSQKNRRKFVGNKKQPYLCTRNSTGGALPITKRPWGMV